MRSQTLARDPLNIFVSPLRAILMRIKREHNYPYMNILNAAIWLLKL